MKRHIQPCEIGGSIYGKKKDSGKKMLSDNGRSARKSLADDYSKLYKRQVVILDKVFRRMK